MMILLLLAKKTDAGGRDKYVYRIGAPLLPKMEIE